MADSDQDDKTPITVVDPSVFEREVPESTESQNLPPLPDTAFLFRPAFLYERFGAFLIDLSIFIILLVIWAGVLRHLTHDVTSAPFYFNKKHLQLLLSTGAGIYFLYFFLFEAVLTATPGKLLGGLFVKNKERNSPSIISIFIRNIFRIVDYPLFFITAIGVMEATADRQRLGDVLARTVVCRKIKSNSWSREDFAYASTTRRAFAFILDVILIVAFFYGWLLMIPAQRNATSVILLNLSLIASILYVTFSEFFFQTTFGKSILGLKVVQENESSAVFPALFARNVFRLFDMNPLGYLCSVLSQRKQRPGDLVAGTVVIQSREGLRGWFAVPFMIIIPALLLFVGYKNPKNFIKRDVRIEWLLSKQHYKFNPIPLFVQRTIDRRLRIEEFDFGFAEDQINSSDTFDLQDNIYILMTASGYKLRKDRIWIQADVKVKRQGRIVFDRTNIMNSTLQIKDQKAIPLFAVFNLPESSAKGAYEVHVVLRDLFANARVEDVRVLNIR